MLLWDVSMGGGGGGHVGTARHETSSCKTSYPQPNPRGEKGWPKAVPTATLVRFSHSPVQRESLMYVGVDLDATANATGPRMRPPPPQLNPPLSSSASNIKKSDKPRRSKSFTPPSARLTQPTKSQQRRRDMAESGPQSSRSPGSARGGGGGGTARGATTPGSQSERKQVASQSARPPTSPFGTPGSSRSRVPAYVGRLSAHEKTHSPSGRFHPDPLRRLEIRSADISANIDYYAPHGAPDNDRKMKEASWLCSQAFIETLRVYPDPFESRPIRMPGETVAFDGNTQSARRPHQEHVETAMRRRLSIAPVDGDWMPDQVPVNWTDHIVEGTWRAVGPLVKTQQGAGSIGRFFSGKSSARLGGGGSSRLAAAGAATSDASAYTTGFESAARGNGGAWGSASRSTPRSPKLPHASTRRLDR